MVINSEHEKFICKNYFEISNKELTNMLNEKFQSNFTIKQVKWIKYKYRLNSNIKARDLPLGSEKVKNGYIFVKVSNPQIWIEKQRYIYEKHYGKIPDGYKIMFLDDNIYNFNIDNLVLVKNEEVLYINKNHYAKTNKQIKETAINIAKLKTKIKELERRN